MAVVASDGVVDGVVELYRRAIELAEYRVAFPSGSLWTEDDVRRLRSAYDVVCRWLRSMAEGCGAEEECPPPGPDLRRCGGGGVRKPEALHAGVPQLPRRGAYPLPPAPVL